MRLVDFTTRTVTNRERFIVRFVRRNGTTSGVKSWFNFVSVLSRFSFLSTQTRPRSLRHVPHRDRPTVNALLLIV